MFEWLSSWTGNTRLLRRFEPVVTKINGLEAKLQGLSTDDLKVKTAELKARLLQGEKIDDLLPEAFALVREASKRASGQRHFDVQLLGGMVLHHRGIAEMRTGEGKTLVATLPAFLNALTGKGVHVVTVNDYLSRRDAVWMGEIYNALGLTVGVIGHESSFLYDPSHKELDQERDDTGSFHVVHEFLRPVTRREAYEADITYGTNSEFGFDYLRDNISVEKAELRQRGHYFAIVDEIDSILIDEARTPLIISAPAAESDDLYKTFATIAAKLTKEEDFTIDEKRRAIQLTDAGITKAEQLLGIENIYTEGGIKYVHHLETAVRAKALFTRDKEYVVKEGEVIIVDEFTGRLQPGRRWSEGLHQAVEAKEGVPVQKESRTFASITYQNYFRMYEKLAGMTGTALTSGEEFLKVYDLEVVPVPTNVPTKRIDHNDFIFQTEEGKFKAIARKVKELHSKGQPVLIGTVSIEKNEMLSAFLRQEGVPHEMLNAKNHEREGEIIAQAGRKGNVTIATNMAGRGVDIKLGGVPATPQEREEVKNLGGLFVLGTERHEARRIDNQLRGRAGRQGDPGETQFFVSLEDSLMRVFASDAVKRMMGRFGIPEDEPIENRLITRSLEAAQGKIEGVNFDIRKNVLEYDLVLNQQRTTIYQRRRSILVAEPGEVETLLYQFVGDDEDLRKVVEEKKRQFGDGFPETVRILMLNVINLFWIEHLEQMDYLRSSVGLRSYGQRDPLVEYKKEGLRLFRELEASMREEVRGLLPRLTGGIRLEREKELLEVQEGATLLANSSDANPVGGSKIGRNELVTITDGTETRQMKFKKAEGLLASGGWKIVE